MIRINGELNSITINGAPVPTTINPSFSGDVVLPSTTSIGTITNTELSYMDGVTNNVQTQLGEKVAKSGDTMTGNLNFSGTGLRITGDFSNATTSDRLSLQTNVLNGNTILHVLPNGTSQYCQISLDTDPLITNSSVFYFLSNGTEGRIANTIRGTGSYKPMTFHNGGVERLRIDASGNVLVTGSGGLGYGTGSGGTVTQLTSKGTTVTLNKHCGQIVMHNASLAAGAGVVFSVTNSLCNFLDTVLLNHRGGPNYQVWANPNIGGFDIYVKNISASPISDALAINFAVIKGAIA